MLPVEENVSMRKGWVAGMLGMVLGATNLACQAAAAAVPVKYGEAQTIAGLGRLTFPTSAGSAEAQTAFVRGVLLLHVFEYEDAANAFKAAEALDPGFALAYWGEAMTYNHPVWNQVNPERGRAALEKLGATAAARAARVTDTRERGFLGAVELLYDGKGTKAERDGRYLAACEALAKAYPKDDEAQLFWSLALLGRSEGVRDVPTFLKAAGIAKAVFERNPQHPGAAHYWIHGMDDPEHATGALVAANALSRIAPDAGHAQHMCSHIFMALGMWDEVVEANENANRVVAARSVAKGRPVVTFGHYVEWLQYAYFQQGRKHDAEALLTEGERSTRDGALFLQSHPRPEMTAEAFRKLAASSLVGMRATSLVETRDWAGPRSAMKTETAGLGPDEAWDAFATGFAAASRGDTELATAALARMRTVEHPSDPSRAPDAQQTAYLKVMEDELGALLAKRKGDLTGAIAMAERAAAAYAAIPFDFGPPVVVKPPHELLGELLLAKGEAVPARDAFEQSLRFAPNRSLSLLGLARAEEAEGDKAASATTYRKLQENWHRADGDFKGALEKSQGSSR